MRKSCFVFLVCCVSISIFFNLLRLEENHHDLNRKLTQSVKKEPTRLWQSFNITDTLMESPAPAPDLWLLEQEKRKNILRESCKIISQDSESSKREKIQDFLQNRKSFFNNLLVDDIHKAIYCYIPKVGCSNWKRIWMILRNETNEQSPLDISHDKTHAFTPKMQLLHTFSKTDEIMQKLETYTKLIIVRDPLERLTSAYFDKIHKEVGTPPFQNQVFPFVKKHRENATLTDITLNEFLDFVLSPGGRWNEHWKPYETLCHPCYINYDVIAKLETIEEDSERYLRLIEAPDHLKYPYGKKKITQDVMEFYTKQLSPNFLEGFQKYFGNDFKMFGYDFPEEN